MWISIVWIRTKPKVSVPWHSTSVNEASMLLLKDFSNNIPKTKNFFMGDIIKIVSDL